MDEDDSKQLYTLKRRESVNGKRRIVAVAEKIWYLTRVNLGASLILSPTTLACSETSSTGELITIRIQERL